jgi:hypothetical protein
MSGYCTEPLVTTVTFYQRHADCDGGWPYNHEMMFGMQGPMGHENFMARAEVLNNLISLTEKNTKY